MAHNTVKNRKLPPGIREVQRKGKTAFEARYTDPCGKQKQRTFRNVTDARVFLEGVRTKVREGIYIDPKPAKTLFGDVARSYFTAKETALRPTTMAMNRSLYRTHIEETFAGRHLASIHLDDIQPWANKLARTHASGTVHAAANLLKRILGHAVDRGLIMANPADRVVLPSRVTTERHYLTPAQVSALADAVPARYRALVLLGAYTGLRWGELTGLKLERVNLLRKQITVAEILVEVNGHHSLARPRRESPGAP